MNFVFTGILEKLTRHGAEQMVKDFNHEISDTVRSNTTYLVAGIRPGSKLEKAKSFGVHILNEDQFMKLMQDQLKAREAAKESAKLPDMIPGIYFMIGEVQWQYNDEYFYREGGSVKPTLLFTRRSKALFEMARLEQAEWKKLFDSDRNYYIMEYCEEGRGFDSFFQYDRDYQNFRTHMSVFKVQLPEDSDEIEYGDEIVARLVKVMASMKLEDFMEARKFMTWGFYELHQVKIGD